MQIDHDSLERLVPDEIVDGEATGHETLALHLERYEFAAKHAKPGRLLDAACGVGYGTNLLSKKVEGLSQAIGADVSKEAVDYATGRYAAEKVRFVCGDATKLEDEDGFDTIVSLETIEHVPDPEAIVAHFVTLLRPGGHLIASVPTTPSVDINPHHLHDFTERSFRRMVDAHGLEEVTAFRQVQPVSAVAVLKKEEARMKQVRPGLPLYYARHPGALVKRVWSTLRHGLANHYITIVWTK